MENEIIARFFKYHARVTLNCKSTLPSGNELNPVQKFGCFGMRKTYNLVIHNHDTDARTEFIEFRFLTLSK